MLHQPHPERPLPRIIQGGMGIAVSDWRLAQAVAKRGQLGVVSGTALTTVLMRRLQLGDAGGHVRRALAECPLHEAAARTLERYYVAGGKAPADPFRLSAMPSHLASREWTELTIVANFVEVFLAKEGHEGVVGLNLLEKIQLPTLASLYGAMLARVDYILVGAGIPRAIPAILDRLSAWEQVELKLNIDGAAPGEDTTVSFDPAAFAPETKPRLSRPAFLAIVSSATLALTLARKASGHVDGFVVEGFSAGGHNAPPRGGATLNSDGEPVYGPRDHPDIDAIRALGRPFWLAGSFASPEKLQAALALGAAGVQIGTAFAFCDESGLRDDLKQSVISQSQKGTLKVATDPRASPTGMPFKVLNVPGTVADAAVYDLRERVCDLGYLRQPYRRSDGGIGYRCPAEPTQSFVNKGGAVADGVGRKCLCNGLFSAIGLGQTPAPGRAEPAIVTAGDEATDVARFLKSGATRYTVDDVLRFMGVPDARRPVDG